MLPPPRSHSTLDSPWGGKNAYTESIVVRRLGQILAMVVLVTCFAGLTAESRRAPFASDPASQRLASSTKLVECRTVDTIPSFYVMPYPVMPPSVFIEALTRLDIPPVPVLSLSPVYRLRPPPIR